MLPMCCFIISSMLTGVPVMWVFASVITRVSVIVWSLPVIFTSCHGETLSLIQYSEPSFLPRQCWQEKVPAGVVIDSVPRFSASARMSALDCCDCMGCIFIIDVMSMGG